tara:strand:- start:8 stop:589 length:582 start_codon:yes stop_codon:yes gene_type:complete
MAKLIGVNKINTSVFISGNGTNLKNLIEFSKKKSSPIKINIVISNNKKAYGIRYAKKNKIKFKIIDFVKKREINNLLKILEFNNIKLICLAGFLKILSKDFIKSFKGKIINIHPSLLPKYKGLNTHKRVLKNNEKFTGCSVHFVNEKLDCGKIILQKKIKIFKKDNVKSLKIRVLKEEYKLYPKSIIKIFSNY